jgi:hypothetical protein
MIRNRFARAVRLRPIDFEKRFRKRPAIIRRDCVSSPASDSQLCIGKPAENGRQSALEAVEGILIVSAGVEAE